MILSGNKMNRNQLLLNLTICLPMKKLLTHTYDVILSMCAHIFLNMLKRCIVFSNIYITRVLNIFTAPKIEVNSEILMFFVALCAILTKKHNEASFPW